MKQKADVLHGTLALMVLKTLGVQLLRSTSMSREGVDDSEPRGF
jgi:hypothetical protein